MSNRELGKAILDADKQMKELLRNGDIGRTLREINDFNKLAGPNEVQKALADINKTMASLHGYPELPSFQKSFGRAINALAELEKLSADMRPRPNVVLPKQMSKEEKNGVETKDRELELKANARLSLELAIMTRINEIGFVLQRVHEKTHAQLTAGDNELIERLIPITRPQAKTEPTPAFLLSIDIRRSTDLMLNAKDASYFADFLDELSRGLANIIKDQFGIFDKFTGDGALAFFPVSFSGASAATSVLVAAEKAHAFFSEHYKAHRGSFNSVLVETGLGIGIDYGDVNILRLSDGLTAVGKPVVYACRFSGVKAGLTAVNQGAYEMMRAADDKLEFEEIDVEIKHQGKHLAYRPKNSPRSELIKEPEWFLASPVLAE